MNPLEFYIDGASRGNPGHSGIGIVVCKNGKVVKNISSYIGNTTNNIAEYTALIWALEEGLILKTDSLEINTDSLLLCNQINKVYKVKNSNILGLYNQAQRLIKVFKNFKIKHIPREENRGADKLATHAIRQTSGENIFDN